MEYVEIARAETERGEVVLRERREGGLTVLELRVNGVFVMDTRETATERELANRALAVCEDPRRVLVGGLGLGFTMHEVLADPRVQRCTVVELEQCLVDWMRDGTVAHGPEMLADGRLTVTASYDLVLLDVDNGPGYLVHDANEAIYREPLAVAARHALAPGGVLAVWSADEAPALQAVLATVFGSAEGVPYDVRLQDRPEKYWLYVARRVPSDP